jgi:hypothetical protein
MRKLREEGKLSKTERDMAKLSSVFRVGRQERVIDTRDNEERLKLVESLNTKPRSVLGAGRADPFARLDIPNFPKVRYHELMDYCQ